MRRRSAWDAARLVHGLVPCHAEWAVFQIKFMSRVLFLRWRPEIKIADNFLDICPRRVSCKLTACKMPHMFDISHTHAKPSGSGSTLGWFVHSYEDLVSLEK